MASPRDRLTRLARTVRRAVLRRRRLLAALLTAVAVATGIRAVAAPPPARVGVLVAAHDLAPGAVIGADDLTEARFAPGTLPAGLADAPEGRVLAAPLRAGEPVTDVRLLGHALTASYPGLTAVPVRLPDAGMAGLLRAGDRIDLVAADPQGSGASVVAAGVPVLALPAPGPDDAAAGGLPGRLVVVGAQPGDVPQIADASVRYFLSFVYAD
jgi:Flp pilus assembly protein CpaB